MIFLPNFVTKHPQQRTQLRVFDDGWGKRWRLARSRETPQSLGDAEQGEKQRAEAIEAKVEPLAPDAERALPIPVGASRQDGGTAFAGPGSWWATEKGRVERG